MNRQPQSLCHMLATLGAGLALLAPGGLQADTEYDIQPIVKLGDRIGDIRIDPGGDFEVGALNDNGQIAFITENAAAGAGEMILQYSDGKLIPIVVSGRDAPGGTWSKSTFVYGPVSMNQRGTVVFSVDVTLAEVTAPGTFLWDPTTATTSAVAVRGTMIATGNLTLAAGGYHNPSINSSGEVAFAAFVRNAAGRAQPGVFFRGRDGSPRPVFLPDQEMPGGGQAVRAYHPSLNDAGTVAFLAQRQDERYAAFLWENDRLTSLALIDADLPGGGQIDEVEAALVNNQNRSVLLAVRRRGINAFGLYRLGDSGLTAVVSPGQGMPGGGTFRNLLYPDAAFALLSISPANDLGQHAFLATITDAGETRRAAYRLDPDGTLSLLLKSGASTDLGLIKTIGPAGTSTSFGVALNGKGHVAFPVSFGDEPATLVLLTPRAP